MFRLTNTEDISSLDKYLQTLKQKANLEDDFIKLGIDIKNDYDKIISGVNLMRLSNNPIDLDQDALRNIILN